ncbi:MAG TPA: chemotaxis protein CheB [Thermoanaerobaculia bacterium]|nr:chemotaxis protein CheB [Thermoanaerobaculia bacterium]
MAGRRRKREASPSTGKAAATHVPSRGSSAEASPAREPGSPFPVVGIGASAGGLEAFTQMLQELPVDTGMGFVLVQHLSPTRASLLAEILSRSTKMPVREVADELRVEPDHVYVLPPDRDMILRAGALHLLPRQEARGQHRPIDHFFRSLAAEQRHQAIGVILSGTATDGTLGLEEIKAEGGITFAQDDSAQQTSMPRSAVATGCVDFVLPPDGIARELGRIASHPYVAPEAPVKEKAPASAREPDLAAVLESVRRATGVDFSRYKTSTLFRRIQRRMMLLKVEGLRDYARLVAGSAGEAQALFSEILVNVTSFFRNPETFERLKEKVFPKLCQERAKQEALRIWTVGCSSGEEAYSIGIAFAEFTAASGHHVPAQIFATDLNGVAIAKARAGVYPKSIAQNVSPERLRRFFAEVDGSYRVAKSIRDMCVFAQHNVLADPPFSQMDLISCRNLLIYLEPVLQQRVLPLLHYALKPAGFLLLGNSETIGSFRDLFEAEDARHKIYAKKPAHPQVALGRAAWLYRDRAAAAAVSGGGQSAAHGAEVQREADRILLARYVPPAVLVDADLEILQFRGDTAPYLAPSPGKASLNLLRMAREGLQAALRAAIARARKEKGAVREEGLRLALDGGIRTIDLEVVPVQGAVTGDGGFLILFEEPGSRRPAAAAGKKRAARRRTAAGAEADLQELDRLKQELAAGREYQQSVIEQQEAANEELQSANEEVQSANEELQSVNEELETSQEEIQSSNEELATVNDELQNRNVQLGQLNDDLINLLASVQMPIVMLGRDLRVRRYTPLAAKMFNLVAADLRQPMRDLRLSLGAAKLEELLEQAIDSVSARECEVQDAQGRWHLLRIWPYRTLDNRIEGVVLLLVDVDTLRHAREYAQGIVAAVRESLLVLDGKLRVKTASRSFYQTFQVAREETEGRLFFDLGDGQWDSPELRRLLGEVLAHDQPFDDFEICGDFADLGVRTLALNARPLAREHGAGPEILVAIEDVTARKHLEEAQLLRQRVADLAEADRAKDEFLALLAHELRNPLAPLFNAAEVLGAPGADPAAVARARDMVHRQLHHMTRMIDDLLDVSRVTQGKIQLRKEEVELAALLAGAMEVTQHHFEARHQEVAVALPPEPVKLEADPTRMEQVFANLLSNAAKFSPAGARIAVSAELPRGREGGNGEVVVRVRDQGVGMDAETLPHVFDLFMQADRSLDRAWGGLGIGLTLVRRLVELHGGKVEARSEGVGKGSELLVRLPAIPTPPTPPTPPTAPPRPRANRRRGAEAGAPGAAPPSPGPAAPRRVLVVDDNVDSADSLAVLLRLRGHEVEVAHDGPEALRAAGAFEPEVVLLDIGLPGLDGYQVARQLRQERRTAGALIVALTGYGQEEDQRRARESGFDEHLTKPVAPETIYNLLARSAEG